MYQDPMKRKAMPVRPPRTTVTPPITQQAPTMAAPIQTQPAKPFTPNHGTYTPPPFTPSHGTYTPPTTAYPPKTPLGGGTLRNTNIQQQNPNGARDMAQQMLNSGGTYKPTAPPMGGRAEAIRQQQQDAIRQRELARLRQIMGRG